MTRRRREPVDWARVEREMRASITGRGGDAELFERALREDRRRYRELHAHVKAEEVAKVNPLAGRR